MAAIACRGMEASLEQLPALPQLRIPARHSGGSVLVSEPGRASMQRAADQAIQQWRDSHAWHCTPSTQDAPKRAEDPRQGLMQDQEPGQTLVLGFCGSYAWTVVNAGQTPDLAEAC
jgi:hypothetical protein